VHWGEVFYVIYDSLVFVCDIDTIARTMTIVPLVSGLGPVSPTQVNSNHQLAYFADHSDRTHVRHQPTAVA